jgi:hypothetical protein
VDQRRPDNHRLNPGDLEQTALCCVLGPRVGVAWAGFVIRAERLARGCFAVYLDRAEENESFRASRCCSASQTQRAFCIDAPELLGTVGMVAHHVNAGREVYDDVHALERTTPIGFRPDLANHYRFEC